MSRSGYSEDVEDYWQLIRWRGAVKSAIRGRRGQVFFRDLISALDQMTVKELISDELVSSSGQFCTLGVLGYRRGLDVKGLDPNNSLEVSKEFGIAEALALEVVWMNDEYDERITPKQRWKLMREWAEEQLIK